jgi:hypothetical protein
MMQKRAAESIPAANFTSIPPTSLRINWTSAVENAMSGQQRSPKGDVDERQFL